ncbi:MAG: hypothetical protein ACRDV3_11935 [Acidothermaceae bacterium]
MSDSDPTPQSRQRWESPDSGQAPWQGAYPGPRPVPYGSGPYAPAHGFGPVAQRPIVELADMWTALLGTVAVLIVGVISTFVWIWLAPHAIAIKDAKGGVSLAAPETKAFASADVMYLFVTAGAGAVCALVAALVARHRGLAVSVAMAGGGILSSLMVAWLGRWITGGPVHRWADQVPVGSHHLFIELQTRPFIVAWPVVALIITFVVALATQDRPPDSHSPAPRP